MLTAKQLGGLLGFAGYGCPKAPIWFIGLEKGIAGQTLTDFDKNVPTRCEFRSIMDLREAHLKLVSNGFPMDLENLKSFLKLPAVWKWMARIVGVRNGAFDPRDKDAVHEYVRRRLGRASGETFLTELSPLPQRGLNDAKTWARYVDPACPDVAILKQQRADKIKSFFALYKPRLVVSYGIGGTGLKLHQDFLGLRDWKKKGSFYSAMEGGAFVSPFFGQGQMSWKLFDELANLVRPAQANAGPR